MAVRRRPGSVVIKQDDEWDHKPPWAIVVKIEKPSATPAPILGAWKDGEKISTVAPLMRDDDGDDKPAVVPVFKDGGKPWANMKENMKRPGPPRLPPNPYQRGADVHGPPALPPSLKTDSPRPPPVFVPEQGNKTIPDQEPRTILLLPPTSEDGQWRERVCAKNYAAMDAESGAYGLIGVSGPAPGGVRSLVMHVPRKHQQRRNDGGAQRILTQVRAGSILKVQRTSRRGQPDPPIQELVVRFTTPARYYSPGSDVTTLGIGVDEAEWQGVLG